MGMRSIGIVVLGGLTSCSLSGLPDVEDSARIVCASTNECPDGLVCTSSGRCLSPDNDLSALSVGVVAIEDELLTSGDTLVVEIEFSRPLSIDPTVLVEAQELPLASNTEGRYRFELPIDGQGQDGVWAIRVIAEDEIGQTIDVVAGEVVVDRTAPQIVAVARGSVSPGPDSVSSNVSTLGPEAMVELDFDVNETAELVELIVDPPDSLDTSLSSIGPTEYRVSISPLLSGASQLALRVVDAAGNASLCDPAAGCELEALSFVADLTTPAPPAVDTEGAIVLTRRPNSGMIARVTAAAGSTGEDQRVELFDRDGRQLAQLNADSDGAFVADLPLTDIRDVFVRAVNDAGTPSALARIRDGEWYGEIDDKEAGDLTSNPHVVSTADFDDLVLRPDHLVELEAEGYRALRSTGVTHEAAVRWDNLGTQTISDVARSAAAAAFEPASGSVFIFGGFDSSVPVGGLIRFNGRRYSRVDAVGDVPSARDGATLTYVPSLRKLLLVGGLPNDDAPPSNEAWLFDPETSRWSRSGNIPVGRWLHAAAYDPDLDRVVVTGGCRGPLCNGGFANGELFTDPSDPAGIISDTAVWDPQEEAWTDTGFALPSGRGRYGHALVFDSAARAIVSIGGLEGQNLPNGATIARWNGREVTRDRDVFELGAGGWSELLADTALSTTFRSAVHYDAETDRIYLFGGLGANESEGELWSWDRTNGWTDQTSTFGANSSLARADAFLYREPRTNQLTLINGMRWTRTYGPRFFPTITPVEVEAFSDAWGLDETTEPFQWRPVGVAAVPGRELPPTTRPGVAYDANRERVVLYGGYQFLDAPYQELLEWNGAQWQTLNVNSSSLPSARSEFAFFYDHCERRLALSRGRAPTGLSHNFNDGPEDSFTITLDRTSASFAWQPWNLTNSTRDGDPLPISRRYGFDMAMVENDCAGNDFYLEVGGLLSDELGRTSGPSRFARPDPTISTGFFNEPSAFVGDNFVFSVCDPDDCGAGFRDLSPTVITRGWMAAARDPIRNMVIGFGGNAGSQGLPVNSTDPVARLFEWDPAGWDGTSQAASNSFSIFSSDGTDGPPGLEAAAMAYHLGIGRMLLFGGREVVNAGGGNTGGSLNNALWSWDGSQWQRIEPRGLRPSARAGSAMAYDENRGVMILVGGDTRPFNGVEDFGGEVLNDTWELVFPVNERPAITVFFDWSVADVARERIQEVTVEAAFAGLGNSRVVTANDNTGDPIEGASLQVYDHATQRWFDAGGAPVTSGIGSPESRSYSFTNAENLEGVLGDDIVALKARPVSDSGNGELLGAVELSQPVLRLRYRLTAELL